jgi:hypothetical protein
MEHMVSGNFLRYEHKGMWEIAATAEDVIAILGEKDEWHHDPRSIAKI